MEPSPSDAHRPGSMAGYSRILSAIVLAAVLLRVALLIYAEQRPARFDFPDSHRYLRVARHIAEGRGPIDSETVRAGTDPVYPTLLAIGIKLGAESDAAVFRFGRIINAVFSIIAVLTIAALARRIGGDMAGLIAAAFMTVDPISLFFNGLVLTESVYVTLLLAAVYSLSRLGGSRAPTFALVAGLLLGAGALTRSTGFFLVVATIPAAVLIARPRKRWTCAALLLLGSAISIAPIVVRNYRLFGQFVPVRTGAGPSLMEALGPWADGGPGMDRIVYPPIPEGAGEVERDGICRAAALDWAKAHPAEVIRLAFLKLGRTWSPLMHAEGYASGVYQAIAAISTLPVYLLALLGGVLLRRRPAELFLLMAPVLYFTLVHMVFVGSVRYRVPMMPMLFVLAAVTVEHLLGARRSGRPAARGD